MEYYRLCFVGQWQSGNHCYSAQSHSSSLVDFFRIEIMGKEDDDHDEAVIKDKITDYIV